MAELNSKSHDTAKRSADVTAQQMANAAALGVSKDAIDKMAAPILDRVSVEALRAALAAAETREAKAKKAKK